MTHQDGPLGHLHQKLAELEALGLRRRAALPLESGRPSLCSNDYLGLAARTQTGPSGTGSSRLISGEVPAHAQLERAFASWLGVEACLAFTSGYAANVGAVAALAGAGDLIVSDALNHASLIDGARLSRARVVVTAHDDLDAIRRALAGRAERRALVVVESYYGMDADGPDLRALRSLCDELDAALYVDEAHALGVLGPDGRGRCAEAGILPDVLVGTLGKAFGAQGAIVGGRAVLRDWLWNRARSFVFSTGLSPVLALAAAAALDVVLRSPELRARVRSNADRLRSGLGALGADVLGFGHVVPVLVGATEDAVALSTALRDEGFAIPAIRPPTVPEGRSRLRLAVSARHADEDLDAFLAAFRRASSRLR